MRAPFTLTEAVLIVGLCLVAIGSAHAVGSAHQEEETDRNAMNRVDAQSRDAPRERLRSVKSGLTGGPLQARSSPSASIGSGRYLTT